MIWVCNIYGRVYKNRFIIICDYICDLNLKYKGRYICFGVDYFILYVYMEFYVWFRVLIEFVLLMIIRLSWKMLKLILVLVVIIIINFKWIIIN